MSLEFWITSLIAVQVPHSARFMARTSAVFLVYGAPAAFGASWL